MNRDLALTAMDALTGTGYTAVVTAVPLDDHIAQRPEEMGQEARYEVSISAFHFDSVDIMALNEIAKRIGLELFIYNFGGNSNVRFVVPDPTPAVAQSARRHPR